MKKKTKWLITFLILGSILIFTIQKIYQIALQTIYPDSYSEYVDEYAEKYHIEREWIFALIKAESNFKIDSISGSGATGLMQLMEKTAEEVAKDTRN